MEELDLGQRAAVDLLQDLAGGRALQLKPIELACAGHDDRALVPTELDVPAASLGVELHPAQCRRPAHDAHQVLAEAEQDGVSDHVAVRTHRYQLLRLHRAESAERVRAQVREQPEHVRSLHDEVGHVLRQVHQCRARAPRFLLVAPVGELGGHREYERSASSARAGLEGSAGCLDRVFESGHVIPSGFARVGAGGH
ncbi:hypothetical protein L2X98_30360 [Microbacterium elymi]|uniref:Uncharacterized protein n=1 Tax=Microbacterium elymi TaxID=2909587 RepID=A0ABY5NHY4_9MICO|nr:hypothetical protein [Microbacterium elymi]UUT34758.1 hypothetical protein L2X98_30360 [Microbacterium elymi]